MHGFQTQAAVLRNSKQAAHVFQEFVQAVRVVNNIVNMS